MTPSELIDQQIASIKDWRGDRLADLRAAINGADAELQEGWKWETAVWSHRGNVCALAAFKDHVKINFFKGASLPDPAGLFNGGLEAKASRSIDLAEGDRIDPLALQDMVRSAVALNSGKRA
ncbi:MAG: DUF1801 domain-containing protein [Candidatus Dormibacteria bacterium]